MLDLFCLGQRVKPFAACSGALAQQVSGFASARDCGSPRTHAALTPLFRKPRTGSFQISPLSSSREAQPSTLAATRPSCRTVHPIGQFWLLTTRSKAFGSSGGAVTRCVTSGRKNHHPRCGSSHHRNSRYGRSRHHNSRHGRYRHGKSHHGRSRHGKFHHGRSRHGKFRRSNRDMHGSQPANLRKRPRTMVMGNSQDSRQARRKWDNRPPG